MDFFIPPDNDAIRTKYENMPQHGGSCGVSCVAALEGTTVQSVIDRWAGGEWPGFSPIRQMQATLEKLGYLVEKRRGGKAKEFPIVKELFEGAATIVRIQWLDEDGKEFYWRAASSHTHYVLMRKFPESDVVNGNGKPVHLKQGVYVFCNSRSGWFPAYGAFALRYLKLGFVSSYLVVKKK